MKNALSFNLRSQMEIMYLLYSLLLVTWGILLAPIFIYRAWRYGKRLPGLHERLGHLPEALKSDGQATIWFHACSVGETLSLQPLVKNLRESFPAARFVFSTITQTGQAIAAQHFADHHAGNVFYLPIDLASVTRRVLNWIRPTMIVIIDTEIWPNLVHQANRRGIPVVLANGRISAASFRYYRCARLVLGRVFRDYRLLMMQSDEDARRIAGIGAPSQKILVTGNIKFDRSSVEEGAKKSSVGNLDGFCSDKLNSPLIVAGSTHPGEEEILLESLQQIRRVPDLSETCLLIAPRHPERFDEVAGLVLQKGFKVRRRTAGSSQDTDAQVLLLDTLGELATAYRFATIAFVGGTLMRHGGHSIMEPALYSKPIVTGPSMENFRGVVDEFRERRGIRQIAALDPKSQVEELTRVFIDLLKNADERSTLGKIAFSILERNRGAARLTADRIAAIFRESSACQMIS